MDDNKGDDNKTRLLSERTRVITDHTVIQKRSSHDKAKGESANQATTPENLTLDETVFETAAQTEVVVHSKNATNPVTLPEISESISRLSNNTTQEYHSSKQVGSVEDLQPGAVIKQRFKLEKKIGRGGMGTIFLARDLRKEELHDRDPYTVIKFLNEELHDSVEAIVALQREAKKSQKLSHPNIVTVYDFDRENRVFFLSMEYLRGQSLDVYISSQANKADSVQKRMHFVELMARGLAYAHQEGFVHADFKPANIFLTDDQHIKILDFGIAQAVRSNVVSNQKENTVFDASVIGALTPNYASLEMLDGQRPVPSDDVYALAVVAYEILSGKPPFSIDGKRTNAKRAQAMEMEVEAIPGVSKRHMKAVAKGLSFERKDRYKNAGEFIDAIKPRVKLRNSVITVIAVLAIGLVGSWVYTVQKSEAAIGLNDLPTSMDSIVYTIRTADQIYDDGDIDQAHKLYAQAWEAGFDYVLVDSREHYKLKVILDRRINKITRQLIDRINHEATDAYTLMQLQVSLEFLQKGDLGTIDNEISAAIGNIERRLSEN